MTDNSSTPNRKLKLRRVFPPNSMTASAPLADQEATQNNNTMNKGSIDTRKLKKPPADQRTPKRHMITLAAPQSPKVISTPPPTAKRSPPRLEPSAKDSRKKERTFPTSIRKPSNVDPPSTARTTKQQEQQQPQLLRNQQRDQPSTTATERSLTPTKSPTLGSKSVSVKERVQMFQKPVTTPVRRTDLAIPLKGIMTGPLVDDQQQQPDAEDESMSREDSYRSEDDFLRTPLRKLRTTSTTTSPENPQSPKTPVRNTSSLLSSHTTTTPPHRILNPYDPAFSLSRTASQRQTSIAASSVSDCSEDETTTVAARSHTPPPRRNDGVMQQQQQTPLQTNRGSGSSSASIAKQQQQQHHSTDDDNDDTTPRRRPVPALTRPLGRPMIPRYVVTVAGAEWDGDARIWKYRVLVQRRDTTSNSFTKAFCFRSVPDFFWLEQALAAEFQGALLVPDLRIALHVSQPALIETPVDNTLLQDWLSDILNGYRGAGEWELPGQPLLLLQESSGGSSSGSTSMESFLYKRLLQAPTFTKSSTLPPTGGVPDDKENSKQSNLLSCGGGRSSNNSDSNDDAGCEAPNSIVESLSAMFPMDFCGTVMPKEARRSHALATARDLHLIDSMAESASVLSGSDVVPSVHSELIKAQRDLAANYKSSSLRCLDCLQTAVNHEERVGLAWRRLADALGALFRYEATVDLSHAVRVKYMPYRKLEVETVIDDKLQRLVQAKATRGVPALREVDAMLAAYIADLSAVEPAIKAYARGRVADTTTATSDANSVEDVDESKLRWDDFRDWTRYNSNSGAAIIPPPPAQPEESRKRIVANEKLLRQNLTALFQTAPLRRSRMAWKYLSTEARVCADLKTTAAALRAELDAVKPSSVSKLRKRHSRDEKADYGTEQELLQRMVHLGHAQKVQYDSGTESTNSASIGNELVEVDNDDLCEERSKAMKRDKALEMARQRIGHWDAALATAIMEAVGVEDPNVRVEETTRELRLVRKYAIGLRDLLNRCVEAVEALHDVVEGHNGRLKECRESFRDALVAVLSGTIRENPKNPSQRFPVSSQSILRVTGIDTTDSMGWTPSSNASQSSDQLGDMLAQYFRTRDAQIEWLISSLTDLFKEYYQRIEVIEGFVYMECVGIQLEKNFNGKRTRALAAFEKKADLTAALAIATKKRMRKVVDEVQAKLRTVDASHTMVKECKEAHLESKAVKTALHDLAVRRLARARELSTERATTILEIWSKEEELNAQQEISCLGKILARLEHVVSDQISC